MFLNSIMVVVIRRYIRVAYLKAGGSSITLLPTAGGTAEAAAVPLLPAVGEQVLCLFADIAALGQSTARSYWRFFQENARSRSAPRRFHPPEVEQIRPPEVGRVSEMDQRNPCVSPVWRGARRPLRLGGNGRASGDR